MSLCRLDLVFFNIDKEVVTVTARLVINFFDTMHAFDNHVSDRLEEDSKELVVDEHADFELFSDWMPGTCSHFASHFWIWLTRKSYQMGPEFFTQDPFGRTALQLVMLYLRLKPLDCRAKKL